MVGESVQRNDEVILPLKGDSVTPQERFPASDR
jgi:hypothetical protein